MRESFSALADLSELPLYYPACDEFYVELIYSLFSLSVVPPPEASTRMKLF